MHWAWAMLVVCGFSIGACSATSSSADRGGSGGSGAGGGSAGTSSASEEFDDFANPIVEPSAPANAAELFGDPESGSTSGGPCLVEGEPGTLYPQNWLRPRFGWSAPGMDLFELRLRVENQKHDLVVYTAATSWTMPHAVWDALRQHSAGTKMSLSIRGGTLGENTLSNVSLGSSGPIEVAPVDAPGSIVFWSLNASQGEVSQLKGFRIGDEGLVDLMRAEELPAYGNAGRNCIGCHAGSPDGKLVSLTWESYGGDGGYSLGLASVDGAALGQEPSFLGAQAKLALGQASRTLSSFSPAHWSAGDRVLLTEQDDDLVWIDLEATAAGTETGVLARDGDPHERAFGPSFSNDGQRIVYMAGPSGIGQTPFDWAGPLDLWVVPYNDRAGASGGLLAEPLVGAADPNVTEYYPALSPDDRFVAFTKIDGAGSIYDNPNAEVFVVPATGGASIRLEANVPPACSGKISPGVTNSWPKWSPEAVSATGRTYYFIVLSSRRATDAPKLYVAPMVVESDGSVTTYKALYLWNQESIDAWQQWGNHTPAWAKFSIPEVR